jgi:hypothetical protein
MNDRHFRNEVQNSAYRPALVFARLEVLTILNLTGDTADMANRKGVFIGAYVPHELKESLRRRAAAEHRTLSQEITRILEEAAFGQGLPPGMVDRRSPNSQARRRAIDPTPRRRKDDLKYVAPGVAGAEQTTEE